MCPLGVGNEVHFAHCKASKWYTVGHVRLGEVIVCPSKIDVSMSKSDLICFQFWSQLKHYIYTQYINEIAHWKKYTNETKNANEKRPVLNIKYLCNVNFSLVINTLICFINVKASKSSILPFFKTYLFKINVLLNFVVSLDLDKLSLFNKEISL